MMGQHERSEALFYYFRLDGQVPENHLLRLIDRHISFEFVRQQLKGSYSSCWSPTICGPPERFIALLYGGCLSRFRGTDNSTPRPHRRLACSRWLGAIVSAVN